MNIEKTAAETLLDKGIKVRATAPLLLRVFGIRTIGLTITQPYLGTLYRISLEYLSAGIDDKQLFNINETSAHGLFVAHGKRMANIAAIAWLNNDWSGRLFSGIVSRWLYWHLTPTQLQVLVNVLVVLSNTQAFTNTIRLAASMRMTKPNLSQETQGS